VIRHAGTREPWVRERLAQARDPLAWGYKPLVPSAVPFVPATEMRGGHARKLR